MTPDEFEAMAAEVLADQFARLKADLESCIERTIAARALPPFLPPAPWSAGTHGAGSVVRHRNGLFMSRRDASTEPPDEAWLPLLVGVAGVDVEFDDERTLTVRANLSDGTTAEASNHFAVPIMRGTWDTDTDYRAGDRVLRGAEFQAIAPSRGVDPAMPNEIWLKVAGRRDHARRLSLSLTDDGDFMESGHVIGTIKPLMTKLLSDLVKAHAPKAAP